MKTTITPSNQRTIETEYDSEIIAGIFRAYDIPSVPTLNGLRNHNDEALTAYPLQALSNDVFLKDLLLDWKIRGGLLTKRQVVFLFNAKPQVSLIAPPQYVAVIIQYSNPNLSLTEHLWRSYKSNSIKNSPPLLESKVAKNAWNFYDRVEVSVLGIQNHYRALMPSINAALRKISNKAKTTRIYPPHEEAFNVQLVTLILSTLDIESDPLGLGYGFVEIKYTLQELAKRYRRKCELALSIIWSENVLNQKKFYDDFMSVWQNIRERIPGSEEQKQDVRKFFNFLKTIPLKSLARVLNCENLSEHPKILQGDQVELKSKNFAKTNLIKDFIPKEKFEVSTALIKKRKTVDIHLLQQEITTQKKGIELCVSAVAQQIESKDFLQQFNNLMALFLPIYSKIIDLTSIYGCPDQRKFVKEMDDNHRFLILNIRFSLGIIDNIILFWKKITEENDNLPPVLSKKMKNAQNKLGELFCFNCILIDKLDYYVPVVIDSNQIQDLIGLTLWLIYCQMYITQLITSPLILRPHGTFDPLLGLLHSENASASAVVEKEKYTALLISKQKNLAPKNLEILQKISELRYKYSNSDFDNKETKLFMLETDIATAVEINYFVSLCIVNPYLNYHANNIANLYQQVIEKNNLLENQALIIKKIDHFVKEINQMLSNLPLSLSKSDLIFNEGFYQFIWPDYNLAEILFSAQRVVCILILIIKNLKTLSAEESLIFTLQQQQIKLLTIEESILLFFIQEKNIEHITKWCYLENDRLITIDVNQFNSNPNLKPSENKCYAKFANDNFVEGQIGIKIETILKKHAELVEAIRTNQTYSNSEPFHSEHADSKQKMIADELYQKLIAEEKSLIEQKNNLPSKSKVKKRNRKVKKAEKNSKKRVSSSEEKILGKPNLNPVLSVEWRQFKDIQSQFTKLVDNFSDDVISQLVPLAASHDQKLKVEINNFLGDYYYNTAEIQLKKWFDSESYSLSESNDLIDRLNWALIYKKIALRAFSALPKDDLTNIQESALTHDITLIEKDLADLRQVQTERWRENNEKLSSLALRREMMMALYGDRWYDNPHPKNERQQLLSQRKKIIAVQEKLDFTVEKTLLLHTLDSDEKLNVSKLDKKHEHKVDSSRKISAFGKNSSEDDKKIDMVELEYLIKEMVSGFKEILHMLIKRCQLYASPRINVDSFFPHEILISIFKFISVIKKSVPEHYTICIVGGFILSLFQTKICMEKYKFHDCSDVDIVTDVDANRLIQIAEKYRWAYRLTAKLKDAEAFKFYFENINIDVTSKHHFFNKEEDRLNRDFNINGIYFRFIDEDVIGELSCPAEKNILFDFRNSTFAGLICTQFFGESRPGLIQAYSGHLKDTPITQIFPQWRQLCESTKIYATTPSFQEDGFSSLEYTFKNLIQNPVRILRMSLMLKKGVLQFNNLSYALQLCFNANQNFILPVIFEQYVQNKRSDLYYAIIFNKYLKYMVKKSSQIVNCTRDFNERDIVKISDKFSEMMSWFFANRYFLDIFTLPLELKVQKLYREHINKMCQQLFCKNSLSSPIYVFLLKDLIIKQTTSESLALYITMLPLVFALLLTINGKITANQDILVNDVIGIVQEIPGLKALYLDSTGIRMPSAVTNHVINFWYQNKRLLTEEKTKSAPKVVSKNLTINSLISPPPGFENNIEPVHPSKNRM